MVSTCHYSCHEESIISLSHTLIQVFTMVIEFLDAFVAGAKNKFNHRDTSMPSPNLRHYLQCFVLIELVEILHK